MPGPILRAIAGAPRRAGSAELDLHCQVMTALQRRLRLPPFWKLGVDRSRGLYDMIGHAMGPASCRLPRVEDLSVELPGRTLAARLYAPRGGGDPLPGVLHLHGGGFTVGGLESHDGNCRQLARRSGCLVLSVDYRLAPEHPFPAPVDDALDAYRWLSRHAALLGADPTRLALYGDSAGATLSTVACLLLGQAGEPPPRLQALIYPATDLTLSCASHRIMGEGLPLDRPTLDFFMGSYVPDGQDLRDPRLSPLFARDLAVMPPTMLVTAGFDMLRDEGRLYAAALTAAGVELQHLKEDALPHGFANMAGFSPAAGEALAALDREVGRWLRR